jgi:hypothetical protein
VCTVFGRFCQYKDKIEVKNKRNQQGQRIRLLQKPEKNLQIVSTETVHSGRFAIHKRQTQKFKSYQERDVKSTAITDHNSQLII